MTTLRKRPSKHSRIADELRRDILEGRLAPNTKLPSQVELARHFKVSGVTAHMAVVALAKEGFLYSRQRKGTFVTDKPPLANYALVFWNDPATAPEGHWSRYYTALTNEAIGLQQREGCRMLLFHGIDRHTDTDDRQRLLAYIQAKRLGGLIFANYPHELMGTPIMEELGIPRVTLLGGYMTAPQLPAIVWDGKMWCDKAINYLVEQGRRRIAVLNLGIGKNPAPGLLGACAERHGLTIPAYWQLGAAAGDLVAVRNLIHLLMRGDPADRPDGLVISDDNLVEHSLAGLIAAGVRVPHDVAVVAHCNFPWPPTSVLPVKRLGYDIGQALRVSLDLLERQRRGESVPLETLLPALFEEEAAQVMNAPVA